MRISYRKFNSYPIILSLVAINFKMDIEKNVLIIIKQCKQWIRNPKKKSHTSES